MKVALIGGCGYIGSELAVYLDQVGMDYEIFDPLLYPDQQNMPRPTRFTRASAGEIGKSRLDQFSAIVVLGGLVGEPICRSYPDEAEFFNTVDLKNFFNNLKHFSGRLIFVSTCSNYGICDNELGADESFKLNPLGLYAKAKVAVENLLLSTPELASKTIIFRFATCFGWGRRMRFDLTVNEFSRLAFTGSAIEIYDPDSWRPYCHVSDFCRILHEAVITDNSFVFNNIFNVGADQNNFSKRDVVELVIETVGKGSYSVVSDGVDQRDYKVNFRKLSQHFENTPKMSLESGIKEVIENLQNDSSWHNGYFGNYELLNQR